MLRKLRLTIAAAVFILITLLFVDVSGVLHKWLSWLAEIQFWPAFLAVNAGIVAVLLLLTLVFGRIYCSVVCPLGIMQDVVSRLHSRVKRNRFSFSKEKKWLRYTLLAVFILTFVAGIVPLGALLEPYSSYGRIAESLFRPVWTMGNNMLAALAERIDSYAFYSVDVWIKSLSTFVIALVTFVVIAFLAWRGGRTYCNTVCPVGTLLSFFARFSWLRIHIETEKCNTCGLCERNCKASCIDSKSHNVDYSRCVVCGDCIDKCRRHAIVFTHGKPRLSAAAESARSGEVDRTSVDSARRSFLLGMAIATTGTVLAQQKKKVDGGLAAIEDKIAPERATPIIPPGALSAKYMAQHCTGCQLCVSQCPNNVLRPSTDLFTMMQPTMSYERGYCRPECTRCADVCPTEAIRPITRAEKSSIQIGHAVWIKANCVPLTDGVECGNCARHCPTGAITMISSDPKSPDAPKIPAVNESRCIGCGACENLCPARPFSAIYVEGHEQHRTI